MGEHIGRYSGVIEALVSAGLMVYGNDYRGRGRTAPAATGESKNAAREGGSSYRRR
jgi:alpha-beta hydrolase superfamily lysophospholipase